MRSSRGLVASAAVVVAAAACPALFAAPASAIDVPIDVPVQLPPLPVSTSPVSTGPVTVGPVTVDGGVGVDEGGVGVDAGVVVVLPEQPPVEVGVGTVVDEAGISTDLQLPGAPPLGLPTEVVPVEPVIEQAIGALLHLSGDGSFGSDASRVDAATDSVIPSESLGAAEGGGSDVIEPSLQAGNASVSASVRDADRSRWSTIGHAAARFGPWLALVGLAFALQLVARSALRDRLRPT